MSKSPLKTTIGAVALIGTHWGQFLGTELRTFYDGPLLVCGTNHGRTHRTARILDAIESTWNWRRVRDNPHITHVIVAVPPTENRKIVSDLLRARKHVLVEKPLALTVADCGVLIEIAQENGVTLACGENIPFRPVIREAKARLAEIGEPRLFVGSAIHSAPYRHPGILLDFGVHYVRAVRELFGEPDRVFASRARSCRGEGDDNVTLVLGSQAGWQAVLTLSWQASAGLAPEFIMTGTRGAMKIWPASTSIDLYPKTPTWLTRAISLIKPTSLRQRFESPETQRRRVHLPRIDKMGYRAELKDFFNRPAGDVSSAIEARADVAVVIAAYSSLKTGVEMDLEAKCR